MSAYPAAYVTAPVVLLVGSGMGRGVEFARRQSPLGFVRLHGP